MGLDGRGGSNPIQIYSLGRADRHAAGCVRTVLEQDVYTALYGFGAGLPYTDDVAALQDDVTGIDGNLTTAASVTVVDSTVTEAIDDLDELGELEF